jgi:hypothetical protein
LKLIYVARVGIFLITVALIVGMIGCVGVKHDLTISSTVGGSVTTPGEGTFTYDADTVVDLVAKAEGGYQFVNWIGDVCTLADVNDATTIITMQGDYSITANFEKTPLLHYDLTVVSTAGGSVTTPGEGTFTYDEGTVVNLVAEAEEGYHFVNWTGNVDTIVNIGEASTTITIQGDYSITANFWEGEPCFIATATYDTTMAKEIEILRRFRDEYLLTSPVGQALVDLYYRVSPPIAEFITEHPGLKPIMRTGLLPAVAIATVSVNTTGAEEIAIVGVMALVSVALAAWATRRRSRKPDYT